MPTRERLPDRGTGLATVLADAGESADALGLTLTGDFEDDKERAITFLDTPDFTLRLNGLLLRRRAKPGGDKAEYTLKCRSEDRYVAAGRDLRAATGLEPDPKLEEDIGTPFISRFSNSNSVKVDADRFGAGGPATLAAAADLFPELGRLRRDGLPCPPQTPVGPVHGQTVFERVFKGPTCALGPAGGSAELAVILWSKGKGGRLLTAELSFRYKAENEAFGPGPAVAARRLFESLQRQDWTRPDARTKTQFLYQE